MKESSHTFSMSQAFGLGKFVKARKLAGLPLFGMSRSAGKRQGLQQPRPRTPIKKKNKDIPYSTLMHTVQSFLRLTAAPGGTCKIYVFRKVGQKDMRKK
mmetsp:Transcript_51214/g.153859  ORF Transcript_51214/g.153859 Transcript_51214/m.153859 type:complete len:99 (+) Transcript_51214:1000-1296(+)